jgi:glycosyltransferase involved in cell wall biosynthesis
MARVAVLIPCLNEAATIAPVIAQFRAALPDAAIHVYDNNSTDGMAAIAAAAGARVRAEPLQGKGQVVRRMFSDIDADIYVLVDGDLTYDATVAPAMISLLTEEQLDLVNGVREEEGAAVYRPGHRLGNRLLTALVARTFGRRTADMLTGYRVLSRRFVKSFPALTTGFDIETEMTVHALELRMRIRDFPTRYAARPQGSTSKLSTLRDGLRILRTIAVLVKEERPLAFFSIAGGVFALTAIALFVPVLLEYLHTGLVRRFPTAILAMGLMLTAMLCVSCGLVLGTVTVGRRELKRLIYLQQPPPPSTDHER